MLFHIFSDANRQFEEKGFIWRSYTIQRPCLLVATKRVEFVDKKEMHGCHS